MYILNGKAKYDQSEKHKFIRYSFMSAEKKFPYIAQYISENYVILENFNNWIKIGGFDNILFSPNGRLHRKLTSLAFKNLLHPFQPFIIGQRIIGPLMALKYNVNHTDF